MGDVGCGEGMRGPFRMEFTWSQIVGGGFWLALMAFWRRRSAAFCLASLPMVSRSGVLE